MNKILLSLIGLLISLPAYGQTVSISSVTASPSSVQTGQTVSFMATVNIKNNKAAKVFQFEFNLVDSNGIDIVEQTYHVSANGSTIEMFSWIVPANTNLGNYVMEASVYSPNLKTEKATGSTNLTIIAPPPPPPPANPVNVEVPVITGTAQVGQTLSATTGTWTGVTMSTTYSYQWNRLGVGAIAGATGATYVPVDADVGLELTVTVTATN